ncbi:MAG: DUF4402 domain-containing protein [Mariniphaga sp.]
MKKLLVFAVAILGFSAFSFGQNSATQTASALVIQAISITSSTNLDFGTFGARKTAASTVVLTTAGSRTSSTADIIGGGGTPGTFTITGDAGHLVTVVLPTTSTPLVGTGTALGGADMSIDAAPAGWSTDGGDLTNFTITGGSIVLTVGATLNVGIDQKAGPYSGTYAVTANYN